MYVSTDLSIKSAECIVACAFGAHFIKEVTRTQLAGDVKSLLSKDDRKILNGAEKGRLLKPLARAFVSKGIVSKIGRKNIVN